MPEHDLERLAAAEADASYRWAAGAVAGRRVLVVGCGSGEGARILADAGARAVVATDPDARAVELARRVPAERVEFSVAAPAELPFEPASFEVVVCLESVDAGSVTDELRRLLAPEGLLLAAFAGEDPAIEGFEHLAHFHRRTAVSSVVEPRQETRRDAASAPDWLDGAARGSVLVAASDAELPALEATASAIGIRDLQAQREALEAWEARARRAEAEGSAKHWELVAAREAQRRLRMRLHQLEHRPLRVLSRVLRGKPARLGPGPPLRVSEVELRRWD